MIDDILNNELAEDFSVVDSVIQESTEIFSNEKADAEAAQNLSSSFAETSDDIADSTTASLESNIQTTNVVNSSINSGFTQNINKLLSDENKLRQIAADQTTVHEHDSGCGHGHGCNCGHKNNQDHNHDHGDSYPIVNDPAYSGTGSGAGPDGEFTDLNNTFKLHSSPNAKYTIYLDFDGHTAINTGWNERHNVTSITSSAYDRDGDTASFSNSEKAEIQRIWQRVAEDFAPFEVNVTTEEPDINDLQKGDGDDRWGVRVVMTQDDAPEYSFGGGGIAFLHSFDSDIDQPVYSFNKGANAASKTASHEVGHSLGLSHDGLRANIDPNNPNGADSYYDGHGTGVTAWQTIMGGHSNGIVQWSKGEYYGADNAQQDDLAQINTHLAYKSDDYGNSNADAFALTTDANHTFSAYGIIEKNTDLDVFSFITGAGLLSLNVYSVTRFYVESGGNFLSTDIQGEGSNLDLWAGLYDSTGSLIAESNPANSLEAFFTDVSVDAGQYFLHLDGVGFGDPLSTTPTGYTDYGSLGQYLLEGSVIAPSSNLINIEAASTIQAEGNSGTTAFTFTVTRTGDTTGVTTADWQLLGNGNNAADANDFAGGLAAGSISFAANETTKTITINVNGDQLIEATEGFRVTLSNLSSTVGSFEFGASTAFGSILTDDTELAGYLWHDLNGDGVREANESGISGVTVFLDENQNGLLDTGEISTTTDANGDYVFNNVAAGNHTVLHQIPTGWTPVSTPGLQNFENYAIDDGVSDGSISYSSGKDTAIFNTFQTEAASETITFLSFEGDAKALYLYQDTDGDGNPNNAQKLVEIDVTHLQGGSGYKTVSIEPTIVSGTFFVGALFESDGTPVPVPVDDDNPTGDSWIDTANPGTFDPNNLSVSSAVNYNWLLRAHSGAIAQQVTVTTGERVDNVNFGNYDAGSISNSKFQDTDMVVVAASRIPTGETSA